MEGLTQKEKKKQIKGASFKLKQIKEAVKGAVKGVSFELIFRIYITKHVDILSLRYQDTIKLRTSRN
jgi:hypothetical protein